MPNDIQDLREHAERYRRLARAVEEQGNRQHFLDLAKELDAGADELERIARKTAGA